MLNSITIALDAMGGDHGLSVVIPAALLQLKKDPELKIILVGDEIAIQHYFRQRQHKIPETLSIHHASEVVAMDEAPAVAMRSKKDSSMRVAINLVAEGHAQGAVSAGNTGALMAISRYVLKMLPSIDRPALMATLPTENGKGVQVLDLGANVDCTAEQLLQFALMASVYCETVAQIKCPIVKLLNIGSEEIKGNELVKAAAKLFLATPNLNYRGFIEADEIFSEKSDVVVCDGFVGNSVLKASEGIAKLMMKLLKQSFTKNLVNKMRAIIAKPVLMDLKHKLDPNVYNGSCLLGLNGIVIKSHGSANAQSFSYAIDKAKLAIQQNLPEKIGAQLQQIKNIS
ncbi:MAG: phosphate acyltransferase PlsX [Gammaproteobacteria bacterium]|nr:phosphate acyltransferase PlsX [Gammaproteobacteria bacterium]